MIFTTMDFESMGDPMIFNMIHLESMIDPMIFIMIYAIESSSMLFFGVGEGVGFGLLQFIFFSHMLWIFFVMFVFG